MGVSGDSTGGGVVQGPEVVRSDVVGLAWRARGGEEV